MAKITNFQNAISVNISRVRTLIFLGIYGKITSPDNGNDFQ